MGQRDGIVGCRFGEGHLAPHLRGEADLAQGMKLAKPAKGEIALGVSSRTRLASPKRDLISMRVVLFGAGSGLSSIKPYPQSPLLKATFFSISEFGLNRGTVLPERCWVLRAGPPRGQVRVSDGACTIDCAD